MPETPCTLLLVDDTPENLMVALDALDDSGFNISVARSGVEALKLLEHFLPDIILLDVMMPGIDGFETCRRLKSNDRTKDVPVIFLTARTDMKDQLTGFAVGGVDYLTKPFRREELLARVNTHVMLRRQHQQLQDQNIRLQKQNELIMRQQEELREVNACKDKFIAIISQDLQQPFAGIFVLSEQIKHHVHPLHDAEILDLANQLQDAVENYHALLQNLLTWTKLQQGLLVRNVQPVELHLLVQRNIALATPLVQQKQIALTHPPLERIIIEADQEMLDTVIRNLLSNAIKFTKPGGTVTIAMKYTEAMVEISVSDTGIGIAPETLSILFRPGANIQQPGTNGEKGTGVGLFLCNEFVALHGGRLEVESQVNQGSTFRVTLPIRSVTG